MVPVSPGVVAGTVGLAVAGVALSFLPVRSRLLELSPFGGESRGLARHVDDPVVRVDPDGRVVDLNPAAESLLDPADEGVDVAAACPPLAGALADAAGVVEETIEVTVDGEVRSFEVRGSRVDRGDDRVVSLRDVTERRERVDALRERERELEGYETVVETIPDGVLVFDADGVIERVNERAAGMLGRASEALVGEDPASLAAAGVVDDGVPAAYDDLVDALTDDRVETGLGTIELRIARPGTGDERVCELDLTPRVDEGGEFRGTVGVLRDVTERRERERELERYETVVEAVGDPVYALDEDGTITFVNEAATEVTGYPEDVMVGSSAHLITGEADVRRGEELVEDLLAGDRTRDTYEMEVVTRDGERIPVENHLALLPDDDGEFRGTAGILRDVSDREERVEELRQYETIVETINQPVWAVDADGYYTFVNPAFEDLTGYSRSFVEEEGLHITEVLSDEDAQATLELVRELLSGEREEFRDDIEMTGLSREGRPIQIESNIALLESDDEFQGTVGITREIGDRKRRREVLSVMNRALRHNLRTNVDRIIGYAELLRPELDEPNRDHVRQVVESAEWLSKLGDSLRNLQVAIEEEREAATTADLTDLVEESVVDHRDEYGHARIDTHVAVHALVEVGPAFQHALDQVIENAIVHNDADEPTVHVWVANAPRDGWIDVHVEDDGPGIPEDEREVVLGDASITQLQHGSGLGLWIARWIVEVFDGEVFVEDNDRRGTVVTLRIPQTSRQAPDVAAEVFDPEPEGAD